MFAMGLTALVRRAPSFMQAMKTLSITPDVGALCLALAFLSEWSVPSIPALERRRVPRFWIR